MSIRPVDYQMMMPKVNEIARAQSEQQQRTLAHTQKQADNAVKQAEQNTKAVHSQDDANKVSNEEKQRGRNRKEKDKEQDGKEENEQETEKKEQMLPQERHTIDIRI